MATKNTIKVFSLSHQLYKNNSKKLKRDISHKRIFPFHEKTISL